MADAQISVSVGQKGGVNLTKFTNNIYTNYSGQKSSFIARPHFGVYGLARFQKHPDWGVQFEILYSKVGDRLDDQYNKGSYTGYDLDYLAVPLMVKWYFFKGFNFQAGPQFSILLRERTADFDSYNGSGTYGSLNGKFQKLDVSFNLGAGWETPFGMLIDVRYCVGLLNVVHKIPPETKVQTIQFSLGVKLITIGNIGKSRNTQESN